jgi:hypothetical protein
MHYITCNTAQLALKHEHNTTPTVLQEMKCALLGHVLGSFNCSHCETLREAKKLTSCNGKKNKRET